MGYSQTGLLNCFWGVHWTQEGDDIHRGSHHEVLNATHSLGGYIVALGERALCTFRPRMHEATHASSVMQGN